MGSLTNLALLGSIALAGAVSYVQTARAYDGESITSGKYAPTPAPKIKMLPKGTKKLVPAPDLPPKGPTAIAAKGWKIEALSTPTEHLGCKAVSEPNADGVVLSAYIDKKDIHQVTVGITGVHFSDKIDEMQLGLLQFDDNDPFELFARQVSPWYTEISLSIHDDDNNSALHQLRVGRTITLSFDSRKYTMTLVGSDDMIKSLQQCNARGQIEVNRKRLTEAATAATGKA
jgi:hypothetical protein